MISIRDGLIQLGFYRTMYTEDKRNSIEGVYDGIYNGTFISIEIFVNGYVTRIEDKQNNDLIRPLCIRSESLTMQDIIHSLEKLTTQKVKEPSLVQHNIISYDKA